MMENTSRPEFAATRTIARSLVGDSSALSEALRFGAILRRRWLPTSLAFVVLFLAVVVLGLRQEKQYRTSATLHVANAAPNVLQDVSDVYDLGAVNPYDFPRYIETQARIIRSREIVGQVVVKLDLSQDLDFLDVAEGLSESELWEELAAIDPVDVMLDKVGTEHVPESNLLRIVCIDTDAARAAAIVNTLADTFRESNASTREVATQTAVDWLEQQAVVVQLQVEQTEDELMVFRESNNFLGASIEDAISINATTIESLNNAATELRLERLAKEARWERLSSVDPSDEMIPELVADPVIQEIRVELLRVQRERADLETRYGEKHPSMDALDAPEQSLLQQLQQQVGEIVAAERRGIRALKLEEASVEASLAEEQKRAIELSQLQIEHDRLDRTLIQQSDMLEMLQGRLQEAELAEQLSTNNISVVEYSPVPKKPYRPRIAFIGLVALAIAFALSMTVALGADRLDAKLHSSEQIESEFGLRVLGMQPQPKLNGGNGKPKRIELYAAKVPQSRFAESLRTVRTNLLFMTSQARSKSILVASAASGEGKTAFACNLASTLAAAGQRTILVDCDLRSPSVHEVFDVDQAEGQLAKLLIRESDLDSAIRPSGFENLDVLPCGPPPPNPAELVGSRQFRELVENLEKKYDRVVLDSPPVLPVTDAKLLGQVVDVVLLVVRHNVSTRYALHQALRQLLDVDAPVLGCVFNGVEVEKTGYRYGYGGK